MNDRISQDNEQREQRSLWEEAWRRFRKNRLAILSLAFLLLLAAVAAATMIWDFADGRAFYNAHVIKQNLRLRLKGPSAEHIFGLDEFGRDMFLRMLWGIRYSLFMGMAGIAFSTLLGGLIGAVAGYYKRLDNVLMRAMDVLLAIPSMLLATAIVAALGPGLVNVLIAISIAYVPTFARTLRASVLTVKEQEFIEAARSVGADNGRIIMRYIVPNSLAPLIVQSTLGVAGAILSIAGLSFLGLGIQPPVPSWGSMLSEAMPYMDQASYLAVLPGLAILVTCLGFNLLGDGLRDVLDPRLRIR